jgi:hypothetical protein
LDNIVVYCLVYFTTKQLVCLLRVQRNCMLFTGIDSSAPIDNMLQQTVHVN